MRDERILLNYKPLNLYLYLYILYKIEIFDHWLTSNILPQFTHNLFIYLLCQNGVLNQILFNNMEIKF